MNEEFGRRALKRPDFAGRFSVQRTMTLKTADSLRRFMGEAPIGPTFRREVEAFLKVTGNRRARFGIDAVGAHWCVDRLRIKESARLAAEEQVREYMDRTADPSQREATDELRRHWRGDDLGGP